MDTVLQSLGGATSVIIILIGVVLIFLWESISGPTDVREPAAIKSWLPLFGHFIGLLRYRNSYLDMLR
jgi:hypothetical protein